MKKIKTRKWVIPYVILSATIFTGIAIWVQVTTGMELSSTLIVSVFGFLGGELGLLASVTKAKVRNESSDSYYGEEEGVDYSDVDN